MKVNFILESINYQGAEMIMPDLFSFYSLEKISNVTYIYCCSFINLKNEPFQPYI